MIEVNKNMLAGVFGALGKMICRTSPLSLCKSIKIEAADGTLWLSTCSVNEGISFELEADSDDEFSCLVGFDEFRDATEWQRFAVPFEQVCVAVLSTLSPPFFCPFSG